MTHRGCAFWLFAVQLSSVPAGAAALVLHTVPPCRIIDTRIVGAPMTAGITRNFEVVGTTDLSPQGGFATGCGIPAFVGGDAQAAAVVINYVAVEPTGSGHLVTWPTDQPQPDTSTLNYSLGDNLANGIITALSQTETGADLSVRAGVSDTHLVADVVGYFAKEEDTTPAGAVMFFNLATCPPGWAELVGARGRYLVGLPSGGTLAEEVGTALTAGENRPVGQHGHAVNDPGHSHTVNYDAMRGDNGGPIEYVTQDPSGTARSFSTAASATGISVQDSGAIAGTNAPYLQLRVCEKQ